MVKSSHFCFQIDQSWFTGLVRAVKVAELRGQSIPQRHSVKEVIGVLFQERSCKTGGKCAKYKQGQGLRIQSQGYTSLCGQESVGAEGTLCEQDVLQILVSSNDAVNALIFWDDQIRAHGRLLNLSSSFVVTDL